MLVRTVGKPLTLGVVDRNSLADFNTFAARGRA